MNTDMQTVSTSAHNRAVRPGASKGEAERAPQLEAFERYLAIHTDTEGWFAEEAAAAWDALLAFQRRRGQAGNLLEIGVWHGKSAALLALHTDFSRETCVLVDRYMNDPVVESTLDRARPDWREAVNLVRIDSARLVVDPLVVEGFASFRWIHIDGEHSARAVSSDLSLAATLLAEDGIVCLDDFLSWLYPQVTEAVFRYLRENPDHFSLFLCGHNKGYLARTHFVHEYLGFCDRELLDEIEARGFEPMLAKTTYPAELNCFSLGPRSANVRRRGPDWEQGRIRI